MFRFSREEDVSNSKRRTFPIHKGDIRIYIYIVYIYTYIYILIPFKDSNFKRTWSGFRLSHIKQCSHQSPRNTALIHAVWLPEQKADEIAPPRLEAGATGCARVCKEGKREKRPSLYIGI
jgi:hypothetical protein